MIKLSPYAKMFYIEWLLNPASVRYNMIVIDELQGNLDVNRLSQAIHKYIHDHLLLHSHLEIKKGEPYWVPNKTIIGMDYSENPATDEELLTYINQPFNLYKDQLCRFKLFRVRDGLYQFVGVMQHLVVDGFSYQAGVFKELSRYYNENNHTFGYSLQVQKQKLTDLVDFFSEQLSEQKSKQNAFWVDQLKDIEPVSLCFLKRTTKFQHKITLDQYSLTKKIQFEFDASIVDRLVKIKRKYLVTPFYFGLSVFAILLYRHTGQNKFVIPYPVAIKKGGDFIYGAQVNTSLMPYRFEGSSTFLEICNSNKEFLKSIKSEACNCINFPSIELFNEGNKHLLNNPKREELVLLHLDRSHY